jgi:hypothetical protein
MFACLAAAPPIEWSAVYVPSGEAGEGGPFNSRYDDFITTPAAPASHAGGNRTPARFSRTSLDIQLSIIQHTLLETLTKLKAIPSSKDFTRLTIIELQNAIWRLEQTLALYISEQGELSQDEVAAALNYKSRSRVAKMVADFRRHSEDSEVS